MCAVPSQFDENNELQFVVAGYKQTASCTVRLKLYLSVGLIRSRRFVADLFPFLVDTTSKCVDFPMF